MGIVTTLFSNITNPLAILSCLMVGIVPWLGKALLGIGGSLLKGIFGGKAKKQEREQKFKTYERLRTSRKPSKAYSRGIDPVVQRMIEQTFASRGMPNPYAGGAGTPGGTLGGGKSRSRTIPPGARFGDRGSRRGRDRRL